MDLRERLPLHDYNLAGHENDRAQSREHRQQRAVGQRGQEWGASHHPLVHGNSEARCEGGRQVLEELEVIHALERAVPVRTVGADGDAQVGGDGWICRYASRVRNLSAAIAFRESKFESAVTIEPMISAVTIVPTNMHIAVKITSSEVMGSMSYVAMVVITPAPQ